MRSSLFVIRHADINGQAAKALPAPVNKNPVWRKQRKLKMCKALIKENLEAKVLKLTMMDEQWLQSWSYQILALDWLFDLSNIKIPLGMECSKN